MIALLQKEHWQLLNADMTIIAQEPKLASHIGEMRRLLASDMKVEESQINIKATTTERLGFCGREEGIAAQAVVLIEKPVE